jgi:predicted O-linked N-acetylglucosamine transferase (SPINDLY family)
LADVALDTFPCTSHTSASDVLWAGIPLVTLNGGTFASRVATSLLITHGFSDLVAHSEEAYFKLASELAINETRRTAIKAKLDTARTASPLFDTAGFTRDLEALYRAIVRDRNLPVEERAPVVTIC